SGYATESNLKNRSYLVYFQAKSHFCAKVQPGKPYRVHIVPRHLDLFLNL
ncbi:hypothetical protein CEXT_426931, partial [Caerostris extrusa]